MAAPAHSPGSRPADPALKAAQASGLLTRLLHPLAIATVIGLAAPLAAASPTPVPATNPETSMTRYQSDQAETQYVQAGEVRYAYRRFGAPGGVPLVFFQRFRGTIDHWDPLLLEVIASQRQVIVFDNAGVGASSGSFAPDIAGAAKSAAAFVDALGLRQIDALGWSMGGILVQQLALERPDLIRRMVLAATGPGGVAEAPRAPDKVWQVASKPVNDDEDFLYLFFNETPTSRAAGLASLRRLDTRLLKSHAVVTPETWKNQMGAIGAWAMGKGAAYPRLGEIKIPALVANGANDVMIHAYNSYAISQRLPQATLLLYPDSGHGFLFQYAQAFGQQVVDFLR